MKHARFQRSAQKQYLDGAGVGGGQRRWVNRLALGGLRHLGRWRTCAANSDQRKNDGHCDEAQSGHMGALIIPIRSDHATKRYSLFPKWHLTISHSGESRNPEAYRSYTVASRRIGINWSAIKSLYGVGF